MRKRNVLVLAVMLALAVFLLAGCGVGPVEIPVGGGNLSSAEDLDLHDVDGSGTNYAFTYDGEEFHALYQYNTWTLYDSYKITNEDDMMIICQALLDEHTVPSKDYESIRTAEDMTYEWQQHNLAYKYLPEDNGFRQNAANVDFDPEDQGRSFEEFYEDRTGEEFDLKEKIKEHVESGEIVEDIKHLFQ